MRAIPGSIRGVLVVPAGLLAVGLALAAPEAAAQGTLSFGPTYQQSFVAYEGGTVDPVLGVQQFHAWGFMVGLERPDRFWQPHLWLQHYEFGQPCETPNPTFDCVNDGWSLSVGPGLRIIDTPDLAGTFLPQVGFQGRGGGVTGGAGFHIGVKLGAVRPSAFTRYQVFRGGHYGTIGVGVVFRLPLRES